MRSISSNTPFSHTKVVVPRRRKDLLTRPRLVSLLNKSLDKSLTLISAPAGYGKTSLLVDTAGQSELPVCWLALDEFDREIQRFVFYFIAALAERFPAFGAQSIAALNSLISPEESLESLVVTLTNEIYETIQEHFILVLDDYHLVDDVNAIQSFLSRFVKLVDENCHLVLSSRRLVNLPDLPRMIANEKVDGLDFSELAFQPEEIQALFEQNHQVRLTDEAARELADKSEGWITGLQMAGYSDTSKDHFRVARATGVDLHKYFDEQVLSGQPPVVRSTLLYTSLFEEFDADLCRAVLDDLFPEPQDWHQLLNFTLTNNLFVLPVGAEGRWLRYHHLFREYLQERLKAEMGERIRTIQSRLVRAYESRGEWERAYYACLQLNDPERLAEVIERSGSTMLRRAVVTLGEWLNAVPPALANSRPGLLSLRGGIGYLRGHSAEALSLLDQAAAMYRAQNDTTGLAVTLVRRSTAHRYLNDYPASLRDAEEALQLTESAPELQLAHAEALREKGLSLSNLGRVRQAIEYLEHALALHESSGEADSVPILLMNCGSAYRVVGEYEAAKKAYHKALDIWRTEGNLAWQAALSNNLGVLYHELGEYENASRFLQEGLVCARRSRYRQTEGLLFVSMGELYTEMGEFDGARQSFHQAEEIAREIDDHFLLQYLPLARSALALAQGDAQQARRQLTDVKPILESGASKFELELWSLQRGRLALLEGDARGACDLLEAAVETFASAGREVETSVSRVWLTAALSSAEDEKVEEPLKQLLTGRGAASHALVNAFRQARPWLSHLRSHPTLGRLAAPLFRQADQLDERLPALRRGLRRLPQTVVLAAPRLIVHSLGWSKVIVNGREAEWPTQSVRELFFLFLTASKPLTKEQVAEMLWPDLEDPERVKQRFKNELYRLRRTVGQETIVLNGELYRFNRALDYDHDLDDFETYLMRAKSAKMIGERIEYYEKAIRLIKGAYLADCGAAWVAIDREHIQQVSLEAARQLAGLHIGQNSPENALDACQRALEFDAADETVHQLAMRAHALRGDRAAIVRQYQACKKVLEERFGIPPSEETEALYRKLIS